MTATSAVQVTRRRHLGSGVLVTLAVLLACGAAVLAIAGAGAARPGLARQTQSIAAGLRCPVCTDLSAADSPAPLARQMRRQIHQELAAGVSPAVIQQRFVDSYGPSVLLAPPDRGWGRLVRLVPALVVGSGSLAGALVLRRSLRRREAAR
jgi:cytochrome c-type biogenesis protein CcmH